MSKFIFCLKTERGTCYGILESEDKYKAYHKVCVWVDTNEVGAIQRCSISGVVEDDIQVETFIDAEGNLVPPEARFECPECQSIGFKPSKIQGRCTFCDGTERGDPPTGAEIRDATGEDASR